MIDKGIKVFFGGTEELLEEKAPSWSYEL